MSESSRHHHLLDWALFVGWMALIFWSSSQPEVPGPGEKNSLIRDIFNYSAHAVIFALLALWGWRLTLNDTPWLPAGIKRFPHLSSGLWASLYAAADEFHQHFIPGRTCSVWDWAVDLVGIWSMLAVLAWWVPRYAGARRFLLRPLEILRR